MATITKKALAILILKKTGVDKKIALKVVDSVFENMREGLIARQRIEIRGFGVFNTKVVAPRPNSRNPRTGEPIKVPARIKPYFKPGMRLKDGLRKDRE